MKRFILAGLVASVAFVPVVADAHYKVRVHRGTKASHEYKRHKKEQKEAPAESEKEQAPAEKPAEKTDK